MWSACFIGRALIWDASAAEIPVPKGLEAKRHPAGGISHPFSSKADSLL